MPARVGLIGRGYFGKRILGALGNRVEIAFVTGKELDIRFDIDWAIIASSVESHYSLVRLFLEQRVNVLCEKPLTLSHAQSAELIALAKAKDVKLYIDDVFRFRNVYRNFKAAFTGAGSFDIRWLKHGSFAENICTSLIYHDLYLLIDLLGDLDTRSFVSTVNQVNCKSFSMTRLNTQLSFIYKRNAFSVSKGWRVDNSMVDFTLPDNDALTEMLAHVLSGNADFDYNNLLALRTHQVMDSLLADVPTVAVVGAGIFGISAALKLDSAGLAVSLFEKKEKVLACASTINQYRLHKGYHYPRSKETALSAKQGITSFLSEYPCVSTRGRQFYAIAAMGSHTDDLQFEQFMNDMGLKFAKVGLDVIRTDAVSGIYEVEESLFDPERLADICAAKLRGSNVNILLGRAFTRENIGDYDYVVNATYCDINEVLDPESQQVYQFELCEKPVVLLPEQYQGIGIVICDGPFACIDPYGSTPFHLMGNVVHAIHSSNIGKHPIISPEFVPLMNNGIIKNPPVTNFERFIESAGKYFVDVEKAVHIGSMFTVRAVLPNHDHDDTRPSLITKHSAAMYSVFSGKISTCVDSANDLARYISMS